MPDSYLFEFKATELDPDLLSTPCGVQTNWHVITGAPSSGKTTLIEQLAGEGFRTVPEGARLYIEREMASGRPIEEIHGDVAAVQRGIKDMQLSIEGGLQARDVLILDRTVVDSLAWFRLFGLDPNEFLTECFRYRYASVFILDPLPYRVDDARFNDASMIDFMDEWHVRDYRALGYNVVRVPVLAPEERLAFVLERLCEGGLR